MIKIKYFLKKDFIILFVCLITFLNPFFYGYRISILLTLIILFGIRSFKHLFDINSVYLLAFTICYEFFARFGVNADGHYELVSLIPNLSAPVSIYIVGKYISEKYNSENIYLFFLGMISFSFSIVPMMSILLQINEFGFTEGSRSMHLIWDKNFDVSATLLGSYFTMNLTGISLLIPRKHNKYELIHFYISQLLFIISLCCVLRLGSRTLLTVALFTLVISYLVNYSTQSLKRNLFAFTIIICITIYLSISLNENIDALKFYTDRIEDDAFGINTGGGRFDRWIGGLASLITDPLGWEYTRFGYAHNFWLDIARVTGIVPLIFMLLFTMSSFKILRKALSSAKNTPYLRTYLLVYFVSIFIILMVEPIMEGFYILFLLFCLYVGFLGGINRNKLINN